MSYVRLGDYKKQQQTALNLYKMKPKNPYYFWAVMSTVMQAIHADQKLAKGVILPLAERMVCLLIVISCCCSNCIYLYLVTDSLSIYTQIDIVQMINIVVLITLY